MADTISLTLTGRSGASIPGDNSQSTLERANTIEVLSFSQPARISFARATGQATGRRFYEPIKFTKRIDRSTPRLRQALAQNESVAGTFRWFRPNPAGDGTTQQFFTISFSEARVSGATLLLPDTMDPASATLPPMEEIQMVYSQIAWTFADGGVTFEDSWTATA
jgi:type VI secretion system secreted protein Hcp